MTLYGLDNPRVTTPGRHLDYGGTGYDVEHPSFAAQGNGSRDNTAAIQYAIDTAENNGIRVVRLAGGTYNHAGLTLRTGVSLIGTGPESCSLRYTGSGVGITFEANPDWAAIKNLELRALNSTATWAVESMLGVSRSLTIERVNIAGFQRGIRLGGSLNSQVRECKVNGQGSGVAGGIGIFVGADDSARGSNGVTIVDCYVNNYETGFDLNAQSIVVLRPIIELNGTGIINRASGAVVIAPWTTQAVGSGGNTLDIDLQAAACLIGYGSSTWKISYVNATIQGRTIIIPQSNDRAADDANNVGGPAGIKLGLMLIRSDGRADIQGNVIQRGGIQAKTANYTALSTDTYIEGDCTGGTFTISLPAVTAEIIGIEIQLKRIDGSVNEVNVAPSGGGVSVDGSTATRKLDNQWDHATVKLTSATTWRIINGALPLA